MLEQRRVDRGPRASLHAGPGGQPHPAAELGVAGQTVDVAAQVVAVAGLVQEAGRAVRDDVDRPARPRRDDGYAGGEGLLRGLAVGLVPAGVHEHVEGGVGAAELVTREDPQEGRVRQEPPQGGLLGAAPHEHQGVARVGGEVGEQLELLLGREPADVPDEQPALGRDRAPQSLVAEPRVEGLEVDAAWPQRHPRHRELLELADAGGGGREGAVGVRVDAAGEPAHRLPAAGEVVALGEADQVGLVDRDARDAELLGGPGRLEAEGGRRRDVHDVRLEAQHHGPEPRAGLEPDPEVAVERQRGSAGQPDREPGVLRRSGRGHQSGLVALRGQVLEHAAYGVRDPVDLRQERLGDHQDPHPRCCHACDARQRRTTPRRLRRNVA